MKLVKINIKDFKVVRNLEKEINGHNIILLGDNGRGKSSVIQFIEIALGRQTSIPEKADGEGYIIVDKDGNEWKFQVRFKHGKPVVTVISPEGIVDTRKSVLANVVGAVDFDIDEFVRLSETKAGRKQQVEIYKSFLDDEVKQVVIECENRVDDYFRTRTEINSQIKANENILANHNYHKIDLNKIPNSKIDIKDLTEKLAMSIKSNNDIEGVSQRLESNKKEIESIDQEIERLKAKKLEVLDKVLKAEEYLKTNKPVDVSELMTQKDNAMGLNANYNTKVDYLVGKDVLKELTEKSQNLTIMIESAREEIAHTIKECALSVDDLLFDEEGLIWRGVPVSTSNLSSSEIMELGVRMKIAENPSLGMLFIQRGESLGVDRLKVIQKLAKELDLQIIMEQVQRGVDKLQIEIMEEVINAPN